MAEQAMQQLLDIMAQLRDPNTGCAWDLKQDFQSILPHTLEEVYEVAAAVDAGDRLQLREELGDLLFQIVFYCQLAAEEAAFTFTDVAQTMADKLVRRHPHVFGARQGDQGINADKVLQQWEGIKQQERYAKQQYSVMDDVPTALPALQRAAKLQKRAANVGFDWPAVSAIMAKLYEETTALHATFAAEDKSRMLAILGDLMFVTVHLTRHLKASPEQVMRATNAKFETRFRYLEQYLQEQAMDIKEQDMTSLQAIWQMAKAL